MTLQRTGRLWLQCSGTAMLPSEYKAKHSSLLMFSQEAIQADLRQSKQLLRTERASSMLASVMAAKSRPKDSQAH